jgi:membrane protein
MSATTRRPGVHDVRRLGMEAVELSRDAMRRFFTLQGIDRGAALGAQAFSALIPLLIVYSAFVTRAEGRGFADRLVKVFHLKGSAATSLRTAFAPPQAVESSINVLGGALLVVSALSFTRALQRLYQLSWDQPPLGVRATKWGLIWLGLIIVVGSIRPLLLHGIHGVPSLTVSLAINTLIWLATPYVLLGRRVGWRRLLPSAILTAVGMTALSVSSAIWMPRTVATSAARFGVIGVAFALLSWLVAAGVVLVATAAAGRAFDARRRIASTSPP